MTLTQLQELVDSGGMEPLPKTALAGNGSEVALASIPRNTRMQVSISPLEDLNKPMLSVGPESFNEPAFGVEKIEVAEQPGYGNEALDERNMSTPSGSAEEAASDVSSPTAASEEANVGESAKSGTDKAVSKEQISNEPSGITQSRPSLAEIHARAEALGRAAAKDQIRTAETPAIEAAEAAYKQALDDGRTSSEAEKAAKDAAEAAVNAAVEGRMAELSA